MYINGGVGAGVASWGCARLRLAMMSCRQMRTCPVRRADTRSYVPVSPRVLDTPVRNYLLWFGIVNYVAIDAVKSLLQMAIFLEGASSAVARGVVGALVAENFAINENLSCGCSQCRCSWAVCNHQCDVDVWSMVLAELAEGGTSEYHVYHLPPVNRCCVL